MLHDFGCLSGKEPWITVTDDAEYGKANKFPGLNHISAKSWRSNNEYTTEVNSF